MKYEMPMAFVYKNLIWINLEMTGFDSKRDQVMQIATVVTSPNLNI